MKTENIVLNVTDCNKCALEQILYIYTSAINPLFLFPGYMERVRKKMRKYIKIVRVHNISVVEVIKYCLLQLVFTAPHVQNIHISLLKW